MATRVAIAVAAGTCQIVEAEVRYPTSPHTAAEATRVRAFEAFDWRAGEPATLTGGLSRARKSGRLPRRAWVTLWGLPTVYRHLQLPPAAPKLLDSLARREAADDLLRIASEPDHVTTGLMLGDIADVGGRPRRDVSLIAVPAAELMRQLEPIVAAGFVVQGVTVPAVALRSIARLIPASEPGAPVAYLALGADATTLAIVRDGFLLFAREIPWGYRGYARTVDRASLVDRLTSELRRTFLYFKQTFKSSANAIRMCGDYPDLRALTAPLSTALGLDTQTLDTTDGIDMGCLPEPPDRFRQEIAALRLAWATAADGAQTVNLLPAELRARREMQRQLRLAAAGVAAAVTVAAGLYWSVDRTARSNEAALERVRQQIARMQPAMRAVDAARDAANVEMSRRTALSAITTQGPRLARALEHIAAAAGTRITMTELSVKADGAAWRASLTGVAVAEQPAASQAAVNSFLRQVAASPYFGDPVAPPSLRIVSGSHGSTAGNASERPTIPADQSGVFFSVELPVPR